MTHIGHNNPPGQSVFRNAKKGDKYTVILNSCLQDERLSYEAKGLLTSLISQPSDWVIKAQNLIRQGCKKDKLYKLIEELITLGYMGRNVIRDDKNQIAGHNYWVSDKPFPEIPEVGHFEAEKLLPEKQEAVKPEVEKTLTKTSGKEKEEVIPKKATSGKARSGISESSIKKNKIILDTNTPIGSPNEKNAEEIPDEVVEEKTAIGKRLPDDWQPNENLLSWASENLILTTEQLKSETENFRDYWFAETGRKATKKDWNAAWRYWVRRPDKFERNRLESIKRSDQRYQSRVTGEALPEIGKSEKYPWQENPGSYRKLPAERWINGIQAAKPNGHWPIEKFGPYVDHPDCLMPEKVKEWCLQTYGSKYLTQDRKGN